MTTADLIKILRKLPQDANVYTEDGEGHQYCLIDDIIATTVSNLEGSRSIVRLHWTYEKDAK